MNKDGWIFGRCGGQGWVCAENGCGTAFPEAGYLRTNEGKRGPYNTGHPPVKFGRIYSRYHRPRNSNGFYDRQFLKA